MLRYRFTDSLIDFEDTGVIKILLLNHLQIAKEETNNSSLSAGSYSLAAYLVTPSTM